MNKEGIRAQITEGWNKFYTKPLSEKEIRKHLMTIFNKRSRKYPMTLGVQTPKAEEWAASLGYPNLSAYCDATLQVYPNPLGWYQIKTSDKLYIGDEDNEE